MYAKNLEGILYRLCGKSDVSHGEGIEFTERFKSLRGSSLLPIGRERRESALSNKEIAAAVFGLVSTRPSWAALGTIILADLRPVGGTGASFFQAKTLSGAVELMLDNEATRKSFLRLSTTLSETGTNSNGGATLVYERDGEIRRAYYVSKMAVSLLSPGQEHTFDPERDRLNAPAAREMSFSREFFHRLAEECERAKLFPAPIEGDGSEYDPGEALQARYRKLGVKPGSRFLHVGVDNQVTWPKEETLIKFDRYHLVLMPKTKEDVQSVHIDLTANRVNERDGMTVINRFLSIMTWCDDNYAIAGHGWSGNPVPVAVKKRDLAFTTAHDYIFDRKLPSSETAMRALALYREARNAQQNEFVSYAVLNYFKIVEIKYDERGAVKNWFRDAFAQLKADAAECETVKRFEALFGNDTPQEYIWKSCRIAVAHANKHSKSDPDDTHEIVRLHIAADVMRLLARMFIEQEFAISDVMHSGA